MKNIIDLPLLRKLKSADIQKIPEIIQRSKFFNDIYKKSLGLKSINQSNKFISNHDLRTVIDSGIITFLLHCEARIASSLGLGFYTIGPCGEELLAAISLNMRPTDSSALHYRHVSNAVCRQFMSGRSIDDIVLDRARGFTCSSLDPITGGKHCAIGGTNTDFIVTSTLASQAPPAVGRALAIPLAAKLLGLNATFPSDAISFVSVGDGSVNNAHFLTALNAAKYAQHRNIKCPVIFAVSDNNKCISLPGYGWIDQFIKTVGIKLFEADGTDVNDVYWKSKECFDFTRSFNRPSFLLLKHLPRRFGHAATDRQLAYRTAEAIQVEMDRNPLADACAVALASNAYSQSELLSRWATIQEAVEKAFDIAVNEPKISSIDQLIADNSVALSRSASKPLSAVRTVTLSSLSTAVNDPNVTAVDRPDNMRKLMTRLYDELLTQDRTVVYIGEDVEHGGYYLVTDGLADKFGSERVRNYPPDETMLLAAAMGLSQAGLTPVVEMPYAKYLDCAADMLQEAVIGHWLSNGRERNGMLIRLQGFDKGVFGGNYHTHNMISIYPGLDVVCYSNGADYARGIRYSMQQAARGRVVMTVDSTDLLNRRHCDETVKDELLLRRYPAAGEVMTFDEVVCYTVTASSGSVGVRPEKENTAKKSVRLAIVTYGNGVWTAISAMKRLAAEGLGVTVVDSPYLSRPPAQLETLLAEKDNGFDCVLFADVCKQGSGMPLTGIAVALHNSGHLNRPWRAIGAAPTYNPLGRTLTFLSVEDILKTSRLLLTTQTEATRT